MSAGMQEWYTAVRRLIQKEDAERWDFTALKWLFEEKEKEQGSVMSFTSSPDFRDERPTSEFPVPSPPPLGSLAWGCGTFAFRRKKK